MKIKKPEKIRIKIALPPDKSISHRLLFFTLLEQGKYKIKNLLNSKDVKRTLYFVRNLGIESKKDKESIVIENRGLKEPEKILYCGNSGTTARLGTGICSALSFNFFLDGDFSLRKRPMKRVIEPLRKMGALVYGRENDTKLPVFIKGKKLKGIKYKIPVASAQVKSSLILASFLSKVESEFEEILKTRDHTERILKYLGAKIECEEDRIRVFPSRINNFSLKVPGDFSSASFWITLGILHPESEILIKDVNLNKTRTFYMKILKEMGARIEIDLKIKEPEPEGDIYVRTSELKPVKIGFKECSKMIDELPLLALVCCFAEGESIIKGAKELRVKESDRLRNTTRILKKMGAEIEEIEDGWVIKGKSKLKGTRVFTYKDHRMVMLSVCAGLLAEGETEVEGEKWVEISYPCFFEEVKKIYD